MAIQTYTVPYSELNPAVPYKDEDVKVVLYTDHLAECREREKAAFVAGATWFGDRFVEKSSVGQWEWEAEAEKRYGEGRRKA